MGGFWKAPARRSELARALGLAALAGLVATGLVFALAPQADVAGSSLFFADGRFLGATPGARAYRLTLYWLPTAALVFSALAWLVRLARGPERLTAWIDGRRMAFLVLSLALGPGLIVNVGLKDHSGRPRPLQSQAFGGPIGRFGPGGAFDGACPKNCAFVSGEVAATAWLVGAGRASRRRRWRGLALVGAALLAHRC